MIIKIMAILSVVFAVLPALMTFMTLLLTVVFIVISLLMMILMMRSRSAFDVALLGLELNFLLLWVRKSPIVLLALLLPY